MSNVIRLIDKKVEKLRKQYLNKAIDIQKRIENLATSERAMERLIKDLSKDNNQKGDSK